MKRPIRPRSPRAPLSPSRRVYIKQHGISADAALRLRIYLHRLIAGYRNFSAKTGAELHEHELRRALEQGFEQALAEDLPNK